MPIDYREYPKDWPEIRARILDRAENKCECTGECGRDHFGRCNARNYSPSRYSGKQVILTIAHLDHDHKNHDVTDDRLKAMCQGCHLSYDMAVHQHRRKYGAGVGQLELEIGGVDTTDG